VRLLGIVVYFGIAAELISGIVGVSLARNDHLLLPGALVRIFLVSLLFLFLLKQKKWAAFSLAALWVSTGAMFLVFGCRSMDMLVVYASSGWAGCCVAPVYLAFGLAALFWLKLRP